MAIQFLTAEGYHTVDIHLRTQVMYGANCVSKTTVTDWVQMYWEGYEETKNLPQRGWDYVLETEAVAKTDGTIREDHRQRLRSLEEKFAMSFGTPNGGKEEMKYRKVCSQWFPRMLADHRKKLCICWSLHNLLQYEAEADAHLWRIVLSDETWCHCFELSTRTESMQSGSPEQNKKSGHRLWPTRYMPTTFSDHEGLLFAAFKEPDVNITSNHYKDALDKLHRAIKNKRLGMPSSGIVLLHTNMLVHML